MMKAVRFETYGAPSVLSFRDVPIPDIKPGDALVEVHAAAINPSDVKNVAGLFNTPLPRVPGRDFAGLVVAGDRWVGKAVWGSGAGLGVVRNGTHAQYVVVALDAMSEKPASLTMEQAAAVGVPYLAAWSGLIDAAQLKAGETVLITGASGAVGRAAAQIARWKKARVIGADISNGAAGTDAFVDTRKQDLPTEIKALTGGKGVDVILDAVGGPVFEPAIKSLGFGGRQVAITSVGNGRVEFSLQDFYQKRGRLIGVTTGNLIDSEIAKIMDSLRAGFDEGYFEPSPVKTWPLDRAVDAYSAVANGDASAKHILQPRLMNSNSRKEIA